MDPSDIQRLFAKVIVAGPDDCWGWRGGKDRWITLGGKNRRGPGLLLEWRLGRPIREGCRLTYACGNRGCCNPAHLLEYSPEEMLAERLWAHVAKAGPDDCWEWLGEPFEPNRYGRMTFRDRNHSTHRAAWEVTHGPIPDGLLVLHSCDNMKCCNPAHLRLGTQKDNEADKYARGRGVNGERHYFHTHPEKRRRGAQNNRALLTDAQVLEIRERYAAGGVTMAQLAPEYGIVEPTVRQIVTGVTWTHVGGPIACVKAVRGAVTEEEREEIRRAYAARERGIGQLMGEYGLSFYPLKKILEGIPFWRSQPPPPQARSGEAHSMAKLTWEKVREIRRRVKAGERQVALKDEYGVSIQAIRAIMQNRTWRE